MLNEVAEHVCLRAERVNLEGGVPLRQKHDPPIKRRRDEAAGLFSSHHPGSLQVFGDEQGLTMSC